LECFAPKIHKKNGKPYGDGRNYECYACRRRQQMERHFKKSYGLTSAQIAVLVESQGGKCAICQRNAHDAAHGKLCVDHCHQTGRVRGMLCGNCNSAIGKLGDSSQLLRQAAAYLERHGA